MPSPAILFGGTFVLVGIGLSLSDNIRGDMKSFRIEAWRGPLAEECHHVHAAVVDARGDVVQSAGDPEYVTYWRSAAKPIQVLAGLRRGTFEHFGWGDRELALACASHSSEARHVELARSMLSRLGLCEEDLACGPHRPLSDQVARELREQDVQLTPAYSNCSGKHAAMLALAVHQGWTTDGYQDAEHPVQRACLDEVSRLTGVPNEEILLGTDGCRVVCFGLPLARMAKAYAAAVTEPEDGQRPIRAMMTHPELVGGEKRLCTELMRLYPGQVVAKVGASGVYSAGLPEHGLGVALKVEDGHVRAAEVALLALLDTYLDPRPSERLEAFAEPPVETTRGERVGSLRAMGTVSQENGSR